MDSNPTIRAHVPPAPSPQRNNITANQATISEIEAEVRRIRRDRGLDLPEPVPRSRQPASPT